MWRASEPLEINLEHLDEVWINGLLSSPSTFVVNTVGAAWVIMRPRRVVLPRPSLRQVLAESNGRQPIQQQLKPALSLRQCRHRFRTRRSWVGVLLVREVLADGD